MRLTLAAVGAVVAALLELTVVPYLRIGTAQPDLVLVFAVTATVAGTVEAGLISAFIGGLIIDLLAPRPLGMTAFSLLACVAVAFFLAKALDRVIYLVPPIAVFLTSLLSSALFLVLFGVLRSQIPVPDPAQATIPDALYSAAIGLVIGTIAVGLRRRAAERERVAW
jgi:rod shape-determining protein MreD